MQRTEPRRRTALARIGPGFVAAASDNDPTTVGTLAVIGSTTRFGLLWLVVAVVPMLMVVQAIGARVGTVTRTGLEDVVRSRYGRAAATATLLLVLVVNVLTIGADLAGGASAAQLIAGGGGRWLVVALAGLVVCLLVLGSYRRIERVLRVLMLAFLAYVGAALLAHADWGAVVHGALVPRLSLGSAYAEGAIALLGTTLTSYAYVWETISTARGPAPLERLGSAQADAGLGMLAAGVVFFFIVVATGATLGAHHQPVDSAAAAARALEPLAGSAAELCFGVGLLASALLALPVLAGTSAYVLAEAVGWKRDLDDGFADAPQFHLAIVLTVAAGGAIALSGVSTISLLFDSSIVAGVATPFTLGLMVHAAGDRAVMGEHRLRPAVRRAGWLVVAVVTAASVLFLVQAIGG